MTVVSNATPLIYLAKIGKIELLRKVFGEVIIPEEVRVEVVDKGKLLDQRDAYIVENAIRDGWLKVLRTETLRIPIELEAGEVAVLSLAKKHGIKEVLMDEVSARTAAKLMGLTPRGTLYVLLKALELKDFNLNDFLDTLSELVKHGFRLKEEVYLEAVKKAREIAKETGK
jgi:predicted nucleic acid-binding protein